MSEEIDTENLRNQLAQAYTRAVSPTAREHVLEALREVDPKAPQRLEHCPRCERVGLPEQIDAHDC